MKTLLRNSIVAALALSVCGLFAADGKAAPAQPQAKTAEKAQKGTSWTPFQLVFLPGIPDSSMNSTVYGLKLGIPATGGRGLVKGVEASFFYSGTKDVEGCQASWFGPAIAQGDVYGIQATMAMALVYRLTGFQAAGLAFTTQPSKGCQAGISAVAEDDFKGFQTGAVTVTDGELAGFQFGAVNIVTKIFKGFQCGAVNIVTGVFKGFQCGVVNYSSDEGIQLGGINIIADSWIPVMPIFNICLSSKDKKAEPAADANCPKANVSAK